MIENFIAGINDVDDIMAEWHEFVAEQREQELVSIIQSEQLKEAETRKFMDNCFRDGEVKIIGTDIEKILPAVSFFGGGNRAQKKEGVIAKLKSFFEKYFGIGTAPAFTKKKEAKDMIYCCVPEKELLKVAEEISYGNKN